MQDQILHQPNKTLLEANEAIQKLLFKAQIDVNEKTGGHDPVVKLIDFAKPENNHFLAINQVRIDTPGCVKKRIQYTCDLETDATSTSCDGYAFTRDAG